MEDLINGHPISGDDAILGNWAGAADQDLAALLADPTIAAFEPEEPSNGAVDDAGLVSLPDLNANLGVDDEAVEAPPPKRPKILLLVVVKKARTPLRSLAVSYRRQSSFVS